MDGYEVHYVGTPITALISEATYAATRHAERAIVGSGGRRLYETAREATPVDTGTTRDAWVLHPIEAWTHHASGYEARVSNSHNPIATFLEHGTKPHEIGAKNPSGEVSWIDPLTGRRMFARSVMHPGAPGFHMAARACVDLEANLPEVTQPHLERWSAECEAAIDAAK
jgi:hypothetical protein